MTDFVEADLRADTRWRQIRRGLGRLARHGVVPWWALESTPALLDLECVRVRAADRPRYERAVALRSLLRELVAEFSEAPSGIVLRIVLGLDDSWIDADGAEHRLLEMSAEERRLLAGREFRHGAGQVGAHAIRLHHEPLALDRLAQALLQREATLTGPASNRIFRPGERVDESGVYEMCDLEGELLGRQVSVLRGDTFPPIKIGDRAVKHGWRFLQAQLPARR